MKNDFFINSDTFNFDFNDQSKKALRLAVPPVDFKAFYSFLSEEEIIEAKQFYLQIKNKQPFANFYLGLIFEFGITEKIERTMALMYYLEGAMRYDPYCTYRLYFIYRDEAFKFNLCENSYLELKYLLLSALFSSNFDNRFNKSIFDPQGLIKNILIKNLIDNEAFINFFKLYKNESYFDALTFELVFDIFFRNDHRNVVVNPLAKLDELICFVGKYQTPQALFLLGKIYFYGCNMIEYDDKQAYNYLSRSAMSGFALAMNLYVENIFDLQYFDDFVVGVTKYSDNFSHNSLRYNANEIAKKGINNSVELERALNLYKKAFFLGDFWSLFEYCELLDKTNSIKANFIFEKANKIYENRNNIGNVLMESSKMILIYKCYSKGIGCKKDLAFINMRLKEFLDENVENSKNVRFVRGLLYYAKVLTKMNQTENAKVYYTNFFNNISDILSSETENNKNFMLLSMKGKCYEFGRGCEKDLDNALIHYKTSLKCKKYFFYFEQKHKVKIEAAIEKLYTKTSLNSNKNVESLLCVICLYELREILFEDCKHLVICIKCMNKLVNKNECPICRTETNTLKIFY